MPPEEPEILQQGEIPPAPQSRSWFQGGRMLNTAATPQGGGPVVGGGIGGPAVEGAETSWLPTSMLQRGL